MGSPVATPQSHLEAMTSTQTTGLIVQLSVEPSARLAFVRASRSVGVGGGL